MESGDKMVKQPVSVPPMPVPFGRVAESANSGEPPNGCVAVIVTVSVVGVTVTPPSTKEILYFAAFAPVRLKPPHPVIVPA